MDRLIAVVYAPAKCVEGAAAVEASQKRVRLTVEKRVRTRVNPIAAYNATRL